LETEPKARFQPPEGREWAGLGYGCPLWELFPKSIPTAVELPTERRIRHLYLLQINCVDYCLDLDLIWPNATANHSGITMRGVAKKNPGEQQRVVRAGQSRSVLAGSWWTAMTVALAVGTIAMRLAVGPRFDGLLILVLAITAVHLGLRSRVADKHGNSLARPHALFAGQADASFKAARIDQALAPLETAGEVATARLGALESYFESVTDGICGLDPKGRIGFCNPAAEFMLSEESASLVGKSIHELLHGCGRAERRSDEACPLLLAVAGNKAATGEEAFFRADGSSFPVEYVFTPILQEGMFAGSVLSFRDISQRHAVDQLRNEFVATVSHELRSPLTSIRGALGLLSGGVLGEVNEKSAKLLRIALTNSDRLARLINDLLDLERTQCGREPIHFHAVQLAEMVRQAIEGVMPVAQDAGVNLVSDGVQAEIAADPDRLLQVLTNLLSNAIKFSEAGTSVSVQLHPADKGVTLSVVDEGRGIPDEMLEIIFGRFQQVEASDARQKGGSGLGLAICRTIVLQHGGRIWAERNSVSGSTFRVFLPYRQMAVESQLRASGLVGVR